MLKLAFRFSAATLCITAMACGSSSQQPSTGDDQNVTSKKPGTLGGMCGGVGGIQCDPGLECQLNTDTLDGGGPLMGMPIDNVGKCVQMPDCVIDCKAGTHFVDNPCRCEPDDPSGPTCMTLTCAPGFHCEEKGLNGGPPAAVCLKDDPSGPTCMTLTCAPGFHCEEKGLNGGPPVAVCVKN
jgi:hypothetical protein